MSVEVRNTEVQSHVKLLQVGYVIHMNITRQIESPEFSYGSTSIGIDQEPSVNVHIICYRDLTHLVQYQAGGTVEARGRQASCQDV